MMTQRLAGYLRKQSCSPPNLDAVKNLESLLSACRATMRPPGFSPA